jgi:hypothetical protein
LVFLQSANDQKLYHQFATGFLKTSDNLITQLKGAGFIEIIVPVAYGLWAQLSTVNVKFSAFT